MQVKMDIVDLRDLWVEFTGATGPTRRHDCSACNYLGTICQFGNPIPTMADVYFTCEGSILLRDGDEPQEYSSFPFTVVNDDITSPNSALGGRWKFARDLVLAAHARDRY